MSFSQVYLQTATCYMKDHPPTEMFPSDAETELPENGLICGVCGFEVKISPLSETP